MPLFNVTTGFWLLHTGFWVKLNVTCGVGFTTTVKLCAADEPQALFAVTEILPPVVPLVAFIVCVVDVPLHPPGNVQV